MEKRYQVQYPKKNSETRDFTQALTSLLNCKKFLDSSGFKEGKTYLNGCIKLFEGSELKERGYTCDIKNSLIEQMLLQKANYSQPFQGNGRWVSKTNFNLGSDYNVRLSIDSSLIDMGFRGFSDKLLFFNKFSMKLQKKIIGDKAIEDFAKYQKGLEEAIKSTVPLATSALQTNVQQISVLEMPLQEIDMPSVKITNPWQADIPEIKNSIYGQGFD